MRLPFRPRLRSKISLPYRRGVGIVLVNDDWKVFLGHRIGPLTQGWQMPQGGCEPKEDPWDAARRELKEETGITSIEKIAEIPHWVTYDFPNISTNWWMGKRYRGQRQLWFLCRFNGDESEIDVHQPNQEFHDWYWAPPKEAIAKVVDFKRALYDYVFNAFSFYFPKDKF